ncbi:hypothetical protein JHE06_11530 [Carnobacterium sp. CS13]|uniref:phosphoribosyltransferase-like protein n=1 Tax=Carnobacterium sp. CS13 TaxID=2800128 RepID=UPI0019141964|nr:hypothetical protein [Carnobacterium sp. CS13]QQP70186.1 hypothetical protein JHE06_11530 [Carnobacterium sp. CS13]
MRSIFLRIEVFNIVREFKKRNRLTIHDFRTEEYLKGFNKKIYLFLNQDIFKDNKEIYRAVIKFLKTSLKNEYLYYSEIMVEEIIKDFHEVYMKKVTDSKFILAPIKDVKNPFKNKSSDDFSKDYTKLNNISSGYIYDVIYNMNHLDKGKNIKSILKKKEVSTILLLDDFSGSGKTVVNYLNKIDLVVEGKKIIIYIFHLSKSAEIKINQCIASLINNDYKLNKYMISKTLNEEHSIKEIENFEENIIKSLHPLGFEKSKELLSFYRNTPNNTFSVFWDTYIDVWNPLFPRKETVSFEQYKKNREIIRYNIAAILGIGTRDEILEEISYKYLVTIIFINLKRDISNIDLENILAYNEIQLKVHKKDMEEENWLKKDKLKLTPKSKNLIERYEINKIESIDQLISNNVSSNFLDCDDSLSVLEDYKPSTSFRF